jgi:hypothetical protein
MPEIDKSQVASFEKAPATVSTNLEGETPHMLNSLHPAALKNLKMCYSSDPGRNRPNIFDLRVEMDSRTPRDRPGEHRWVQVGQQFSGSRDPGTPARSDSDPDMSLMCKLRYNIFTTNSTHTLPSTSPAKIL